MEISALLDEVARSVEPHCAASQRVNFDMSAGDTRVRGNPRVLASAIENLVINALQSCGAGAVVDVAVATAEEKAGSVDGRQRFAESSVDSRMTHCVHIRISDNGPGVSVDDEQRIFEPFYSSRPGGTGLGLAAARSIVRAHRGEIVLEQRPQSGASFVVTLPLPDKENRIAP